MRLTSLVLAVFLVLASPDGTLRLSTSEVPKPATFGLLAAGIAALFIRRHKNSGL